VLKQKTKDNYGKKGNYNDYTISTPPGFVGMGNNLKGRNYSPAWGGQFQNGGYIDSVLNANKKLDWVQRLYEKNTPSIQIKGQKGRSTHFMESADNRVYPTVVRENGKLKYIGDKAYDYADSTKTYIEFPSEKEATWFAENYKKGTNVLKKENGGNLMPAMAGANQTIPMYQMGGSLPGAVGFMYARTQNPAPSNGPYAKKTKASAQNGQEMKYYQEGLDFTPKTISQDGDKIYNEKNIKAKPPYNYPESDPRRHGLFARNPNKREPIIVSDPNDPRLRAYQDSLSLYNQYLNDVKWAADYFGTSIQDVLKGYERLRRPIGSETYKLNNEWIKNYDKKGYNPAIKPTAIYDFGEHPFSGVKEYKKPVQPVILQEEPKLERPIPIPRDTRDLGYNLPTPGAPSFPKLNEYNPDTPTKYSFTYPTGKYNEQKTMYFPTKSALKAFTEGIRGATYQEGDSWASATGNLQDGGNVDPMGYWNPDNWGKAVTIPSNEITMEGVDVPLVGISDTGDVQYMEPGEDYEFDGEYVTEYPIARGGVSVNNADAQPIEKLDQLLNFTNYNKPTKGGWLDKYN
jgi:CRISPR-associated Cas5-like protein